MTRTSKWGAAAHLTRALFAQDKIWVTDSAEVLTISDMEHSHVLNTLLMIERIDDFPAGLDIHESPLYTALYGRLFDVLGPDEPDFVMPERRIADTRRDILALLEEVKNASDPGAFRFKVHYVKDDGTESHRTVVPLEVYERGVGIGFPEQYLRAIDIDICGARTFRADRIQRLEEVPSL